MTRPARCLLLTLAVAATQCGPPTAPSNGPQIFAVSPPEGTTFGGTRITISGRNFTAGASVTIGGAPASDISVDSSAAISASTPAHAAGPSDVVVTAASGTAMLGAGYRFVAPTVSNAPPRIVAIRAQGLRANEPPQFADVGESIVVAADIEDPDTPLADLAFEWSADAGVVSGTGRSVTYVASGGRGLTTVRLKIIDSYLVPDASGLPVKTEHIVSGSIAVDVHDSVKEVGDMARDFLVMFSQSSVSPQQVMRDFQDGCGAPGLGRAEELVQVIENREFFVIQPNWFVGVPRVTVSFRSLSPFRARPGDAWAAVDVSWNSTCLKTSVVKGCPAIGFARQDTGVDWVTAHYDPPTRRWWLCDSDYESRTSNSLKPYKR